MSQTVGELLDGLDIKLDVKPNQRLTEVLIVARALDLTTGNTSLVLSSSHIDWIMETALLESAKIARQEIIAMSIRAELNGCDCGCDDSDE